MNLPALAKAIEPLNYVVMRNWDDLPETLVGDIDFFVDNKHYDALKAICEAFLEPNQYDIRTTGDGYYSYPIERNLLQSRRLYNGFWVPNHFAHFMSLYYHNLIHKGDGRYDERLKKLFCLWAKPVEPQDKGVGYHASDTN